MGISFSSTSEHTKAAVEAIADLNPNAADILITTVITSLVTDLGVVSPTASGLLTVYDGSNNKASTIDGYCVAPKELKGGDLNKQVVSITYGGYVETGIGANTAAVPGIYKILEFVFDKYASLPLKVLFEYPIKIAKEGFLLADVTLEYFEYALDPIYSWDPTSKKHLSILDTDNPNEVIMKMGLLGDTYQYIADNGFNEFYFGDVGKSLCKTISSGGGHITMKDLNSYKLIHDSKFTASYKDLKLTGHSGPSIGGLMVLKYLNAFQDKTTDLVTELHQVYIDRKDNFEIFEDRKTMVTNEISKAISSPSTIQFSISDTENNHFALTVSSGYGSGLLCPLTGMYFNNSLGEIELNPQGFLGETSGDRLISNMSPMIIEVPNGIYTIGSPGADRISSAIAIVINNYLLSSDWSQSIDLPRFHVNQDKTIRAEPDAIQTHEKTVITKPNDMYFGGVCMTGLIEGTELFAKGDKRRGDVSAKTA